MNKKLASLFLLAALLLSACGDTVPDSSASALASAPVSEPPAETESISSQPSLVQPDGLSADIINSLPAGTKLSADDLSIASLEALFVSSAIPDEVFARMDGVSFGADCTVSRNELRYLRVLHVDIHGDIYTGELVCNKAIADDLTEIFQALYEHRYPIEKIRLVDAYDGDDERSMADNNTSCFNFRSVPNTTHLSNHAYGLALDINPLYNPYVTSNGYSPDNAGTYIDRDGDYDYKITEDDFCCQLFLEHGFTWGGSWQSCKDYQHFEREP